MASPLDSQRSSLKTGLMSSICAPLILTFINCTWDLLKLRTQEIERNRELCLSSLTYSSSTSRITLNSWISWFRWNYQQSLTVSNLHSQPLSLSSSKDTPCFLISEKLSSYALLFKSWNLKWYQSSLVLKKWALFLTSRSWARVNTRPAISQGWLVLHLQISKKKASQSWNLCLWSSWSCLPFSEI